MTTTEQLIPMSDDAFYAVIDRLKAQKALPLESFTNEIPFFNNIRLVSKETQVKELFENKDETDEMYRQILESLMSGTDASGSSDFFNKTEQKKPKVMNFAQIVLYKTLPCPDENCRNRPREIATHNQYKDNEYECPFYHHDRDCRRVVVTSSVDEEFVYKANYYEEGKRHADREKYSQNYFESMFHPLYYKMFKCKREFCNESHFCPFFHNEEEKKSWDQSFADCIKKDRISYVKDKQKYYDHATDNRRPRNVNQAPEANRGQRNDYKPKFRNSQRDYQQIQPQEQTYYVDFKPYQNKSWDWKKSSNDSSRKNSDEYPVNSKISNSPTYTVC